MTERGSHPVTFPRRLIAALGLLTLLVIGPQMILGAIPAGPDVPVGPNLVGWVNLMRLQVQPKMGPVRLSPPRLIAVECSPDGMQAAFRFQAPVTGQITTLVTTFEAEPAASGSYWALGEGESVGAEFDPSSCSSVPFGPLVP